MATIINDLLGGGISTGVIDEFGLPVAPKPASPHEYGAHVSREDILQPLSKVHPLMFGITDVDEDHNLPTTNFYNRSLADIEAGWTRGLYTLESSLGLEAFSVMIRKPVAGAVLRFFVADLDCTAEVWSSDKIDAGIDCGKNQVWKADPEIILDERHAMFVEVLAIPKDMGCCPLIVSINTVSNDYCHEDYLDMPINCCTPDPKDIGGCECTEKYEGSHEVL